MSALTNYRSQLLDHLAHFGFLHLGPSALSVG